MWVIIMSMVIVSPLGKLRRQLRQPLAQKIGGVESTPSSWSWNRMAEVIILVLLPIWKGESAPTGAQVVTSVIPVDLR